MNMEKRIFHHRKVFKENLSFFNYVENKKGKRGYWEKSIY